MNAATVYLSKWPESSDTRKTMKQALTRVAGVLSDGDIDAEKFDWHKLRYEDVRTISAQLADENLMPRTINKMLSAVRGTLEAAWRSGDMPDEVYRKIKIENVSGDGDKAGRVLDPGEMDHLAELLSDLESQEASIIAALAGAGLRRVELVRLHVHDYDPAQKRLTATGKGRKRRSIPLGERWQAPFELWWKQQWARGHMIKLFNFGETDARRRVSYVIEKCCTKHNLQVFTPHDLRRTFGTRVYETAGIAMAQKLLGHSNINTTALYLRVNVEAEAAAVRDL